MEASKSPNPNPPSSDPDQMKVQMIQKPTIDESVVAVEKKMENVTNSPTVPAPDSNKNKRKRRQIQTKPKPKPKKNSVLTGIKKKKKPVRRIGFIERRTTLDKDCFLYGNPIPLEESQWRWPHRYLANVASSSRSSIPNDNDESLYAKCHYLQASIAGEPFLLGDGVEVEAGDNEENYIGKIVEFFMTTDDRSFFTAQWFFKAKDTDIKAVHADLIDAKRVFISDYKNANPLDCILRKLTIVQIAPSTDLEAKKKYIPPDCDFYYDMQYSKSYSTFCNIPKDIFGRGLPSLNAIEMENTCAIKKTTSTSTSGRAEMSLLDLFAGCGGMSTGLCLGAAAASVQLSTKWAVDFNEHACQSIKINHPSIEVRHETAEDFLSVLKEWRRLCEGYGFLGPVQKDKNNFQPESLNESEENDDIVELDDSELLEVNTLVGICVGDPNETGHSKLHFKVRWLGYEADADTWEPLENLNCPDKVYDFVKSGYEANILPLTGKVDVVCGGPPCQGISGHNRFRSKEKPLSDKKNQQLTVFMDIVDYLKPRFVLMENVVDILKFAKGFLIQYATARLVSSNYQTRLGMLAAGHYGLPQYRVRAFLWGALPTENLPTFPLPTHHAIKRGGTPKEFVENFVAYDANETPNLGEALLIGDAISELPSVENDERRVVIPYENGPQTNFQRFIRSSENELMGVNDSKKKRYGEAMLFDHLPLKLSNDDMERVRKIPHRQNACFRDLGGLIFQEDKKVLLDPNVERPRVASGKPLVPDYTLSWKEGYSFEPFGRLWWNETVSTVVTRAQPHNRKILHPNQDRVLTIRENARLQGFPDYYRFSGPVKQKYMQVGNAVAVPVGRALGYVLGLASRDTGSSRPVTKLPENFSRLEDVFPEDN